jgi:3-hydroxybutyryl-CoA dehydrogenase
MKNINTNEITVGVVGLGLMGSSFIVSLLIAGHEVKAIAPIAEDLTTGPDRINNHLLICSRSGLLSDPIESYASRLSISEDYSLLSECDLVMECVIELPEVKKSVYNKIERIVGRQTVITSNTSAIPISHLQTYLSHPERFLGIHWAEPAYLSKFMEIICGDRTDTLYADWVYELAHCWEKEPILLRKDLRGFVANRLMYAVYREGFVLVENGQATMDDIDKAFRYDPGSWMTLMGIFRRMDFMGLKDYSETFKAVFPLLSNTGEVPAVMQQIVEENARGTQSLKGLYEYTPEEAKKWDDAFAIFTEDIHQLAAQYPSKRESISNKI